MPSSTASVSPSARHSATNASSASASSSILSAIVSQPRRLVTSGVPSGAHSVPSCCQIRRATSSSAARRTRSASGVSSSGGRSASLPAGRPVGTALRLRSMPPSSLFIGAMAFATACGGGGCVASGRAQRAVVLPHPARDVLLGGAAHALGQRGLELGRHVGLDRGGAAGGHRLALALDAVEQLVHRLDELVDGVAQERVRDVVEVDA